MSKPVQPIYLYVTGFILSVILTITAYALVQAHHSNTIDIRVGALMAIVAVLAVLQLAVQLIFFLHLDQDRRPYWNLHVFAFALGVIGIIVGGSMWIMSSLDYHMSHKMNQQQVEKYMHEQDSL